jgi:phospholipid-binding lipoprotein MlaA
VGIVCAAGPIGGPSVVHADTAAPDPLFDEDAETPPAGFPDPIEGVNRSIFRFNRMVDAWVMEPVTRAYRFVVPAPGRRAIRRAFVNLDSPVTIANDLLQLEPKDAGVTLARFVINTTVGIAGFFDVASSLELEAHQSDFGQTLALSGVPSGPYLVFPVLGPTTVRDGTGFLVDFLFRPTTYLVTPGGAVFLSSFGVQSGQDLLVTTLFEGTAGITTRDAAGEGLQALEASSLDFYTALRNAYYQNRMALIWRRGPEHGPLAVARRALTVLPFRASGGQVGHLPAHGGEQPVESVALQH